MPHRPWIGLDGRFRGPRLGTIDRPATYFLRRFWSAARVGGEPGGREAGRLPFGGPMLLMLAGCTFIITDHTWDPTVLHVGDTLTVDAEYDNRKNRVVRVTWSADDAGVLELV